MATNILALANHIQQQGELGRERGTQTRLNRLTGQAMAAPDAQARDQFVQQTVATNPQAGFALQDRFQSQDEARGLKARNAAKMVLDAWGDGMDASKAQAADRAYQMVRPFLVEEGRKYGKEPPPSFTEDMVPNMRAIVAMNGGADGNPYAGLPSDIQSLRFLQDNPQLAALDRERRQAGGMVPKLVQTAQGYGWGTPGAGIQLAPLDGVAGQQGGQQGAAAPGYYQTPQGVVRIGDDLSPQERAVAMADINAGGRASEVTLPPQQGAQGAAGIAQPYQAPQRPSIPAGYRETAGGNLEAIPGGPADLRNNPTPADQAKGEMGMRKELQDRVKQDRSVLGMFQNVESAAKSGTAAGDLSMIFAYMKMLDPGSVVREQEFANAQNATGVPDRIRNTYNQVMSGNRLNPQQRVEFLNEARQLASAAQSRVTNATREYQGIAEQYGYDPTRATGAPDFRDVTGGAAPTAKQNSGGVLRYNPATGDFD